MDESLPKNTPFHLEDANPAKAARVVPRRKPGAGSGQALLEFTIALAMMLAIAFGLFVFLSAFSEYGWRILNLVGLKYP